MEESCSAGYCGHAAAAAHVTPAAAVRRRIGCLGWLLWLAAALVLLLVLALLFGGWQKGTKAGLAQPRAVPMPGRAGERPRRAAYQP